MSRWRHADWSFLQYGVSVLEARDTRFCYNFNSACQFSTSQTRRFTFSLFWRVVSPSIRHAVSHFSISACFSLFYQTRRFILFLFPRAFHLSRRHADLHFFHFRVSLPPCSDTKIPLYSISSCRKSLPSTRKLLKYSFFRVYRIAF